MDFGNLLKKSFEDYKTNFKLFLKMYVWLALLPLIPYMLFYSAAQIQDVPLKSYGGLGITGNMIAQLSMAAETQYASVYPLVLFLFVVSAVAYFICSLIISTSLIYISLYNQNGKMRLKQALKGGLTYFWNYIGLIIIMGLIMLVFFIPAILVFVLDVALWSSIGLAGQIVLTILGILLTIWAFLMMIYYGVCWTFSVYIVFGERGGIIQSLGRSRKMVYGRWWRTFGYLLLIWLIIVVAGGILWVPEFLINVLFAIALLFSSSVGGFIQFLTLFLGKMFSGVFEIIFSLITMPFFVFFLKNMYLEMKGRKR